MLTTTVPAFAGLKYWRARGKCALFALAIGGAALAGHPYAAAQSLSALPAQIYNAGGNIYSIAVQADGKMLIAGVFSGIGSTATLSRIVRINTDGTLDVTFAAPQVDGSIDHLAIAGNTLYLGGLFNTVNSQPRTHLAAIDLTSGNVLAWNPAPDGYISALQIASGALYAGGTFTHMGGAPHDGLAAFDAGTGTALM